jgi:uncharacterized membrane protein
MTRDDIIKWAREAGIDEFGSLDERLIFFAALVAAQEREACATACEEFYSIEWLAQHCAAAIRARGQA